MIRRLIFTCITLFIAFAFNLRTSAHVYIVTDTNDTTKIKSLRGAILEANRHGGQNTIILGEEHNFRDISRNWVYPLTNSLTLANISDNGAQAGELDITRGELTIIGMSPSVTIDASNLDNRVFFVFPQARLILENLTITGGNASLYSPANGGAIYNEGILEMEDCTLDGNAAGNGILGVFPGSSPNGGDGGAIYNTGKLAMYGCIVAENSSGAGVITFSGTGANGGNGGGIYNSGELILDGCVVSNNFSGQGANGDSNPPEISPGGDGVITTMFNPFTPGVSGGKGGDGGGIYNAGQASLYFSTINDNGSGNGGNGSDGDGGGSAALGGNGAGIFNSGTLNLNTCTVSQNFCGNGGAGGLGDYDGNGANGGVGGNGGGIYNDGVLVSTSSTIAFNLAGAGGDGGNSYTFSLGTFVPPGIGGTGGSGGGIFNNAQAANAVLRNTLVASNAANTGGNGGTNFDLTNYVAISGSNGIGFDLAGNFASQGFNLISTGDGSTGLATGVIADQVGSDANPIDPLLGPLQMNGGFTPTHALLWGSPAIDQGKCFGIHRDQRGNHRPYIYPSIPRPPGGDGSDIGAFELDVRMN